MAGKPLEGPSRACLGRNYGPATRPLRGQGATGATKNAPATVYSPKRREYKSTHFQPQPMKLDHHTVLNAVSRSIILCDSDVEEAKEGLYALGDYLKYFFAATARQQSEPSPQDIERVHESLNTLHQFLQGRAGG